MDYKKSKAPTNTVTHNLMDFCKGTDNVYESVVIMSKRANQISVKIEISKYYERLPKPTLIAADEFLKGKLYFRNPAKDKEKLSFDL